MIKILSNDIYVLFDSGATHSFTSTNFIKRNSKLSPVSLETILFVSTSSGEVILVNSICKDCILNVEDREMKTDLLVLEMRDFDLIFGMDWLVAYHTTIDCFEKTMKFQITSQLEFSYMGSKLSFHPKIILAFHAKRLLEEGCEGFLAIVIYT